MKSKRFLLALTGMGLCVALLMNCSKEDTKEMAPKEVAVAQDNESQDAVSENITQSLDNILDAVEANGFSGLKAAPYGTGINVTIDKAGTTLASFPKLITITYNIDTLINGEHAVQTGEIKIVVSLTQSKEPFRNYIKRVITIDQAKPFTVTTDSFSVALYGSRTMERKSVNLAFSNAEANMRMAVLDTIYSNLNFKITCGDFVGNFTQLTNKSRQAIAYFERSGNFFRQNHKKDSLVYKGKVEGTNLKGDTYSRIIIKPVVFTVCPNAPHNPVVSQGEIELKNGSEVATLQYSANSCQTKVVISKDGASKEISRKLNHRFYKWW